MLQKLTSLLFFLYAIAGFLQAQQSKWLHVDFYGDSVSLSIALPDTVDIAEPITEQQIKKQAAYLVNWHQAPLLDSLLAYKHEHQLDDWIYYQLIRKTSQQLFPKEVNYGRYTVMKWFLLTSSGYDATLKLADGRLLFYVQCDEDIFNIPYYKKNGRQYVCLNYHDYGYFDIKEKMYEEIDLPYNQPVQRFSYKVNRIPEGKDNAYVEKELEFKYFESVNNFKIKLNPSIRQMFANYPVVDYETYFNIPLSRETYHTLIPALEKHIAKMKVKNGVDFLMHFTRYAFLFETDTEHFGREKRLTPEQTILYQYSDCEDRAALFFYLVKEIYNLPMIVLSYPHHISIAVKLKKAVGRPILYNGEKYTETEPTPQQEDLPLGKMVPSLRKTPYQVVYAYDPHQP